MVDEDVILTPFQNWVLFYFLKSTESKPTAENLMDNMCLTALIDFEYEDGVKQLHKLIDMGLIDSQHIQSDVNQPVYFMSTQKGKFFVKQKVLLPLLTAKQKDKIQEVLDYMESKNESEFLIRTIKSAFEQENPNAFFEKLSSYALNHVVPFTNFLIGLKDHFGDF